MLLTALLKKRVFNHLTLLFPDKNIKEEQINITLTKPEFEGDYSVVLFPFLKLLGIKPDVLGHSLGEALVAEPHLVADYSIVGGYLNLSISDTQWLATLSEIKENLHFGYQPKSGQKIMIEYSSPNTNKPLHFGHLRNIFLGFAVARIAEANGHEVIKANLINDRGIHICKSMLAWQETAHGATPQSTGLKGDHLVGQYYVRFNEMHKEEVEQLVASGMDKSVAEKQAGVMHRAQAMLQEWEAGNEEVRTLWKQMNDWVYTGFEETYRKLGVDFDRYYYESDTYLLGKEIVNKGLAKGILFQKEDGSVWIDLTEEGLDQKLLLRSDGTSVYMTQDLGTAVLKYNDYGISQSVYVIGDEQNYHMQVLKLILHKLGEPAADGIHHLSYGMVELPHGRMKSREGTVVDADDMVTQMVELAKQETERAGKTEGFTDNELKDLYHTIGLGALKFYLLRVDPKKKMIFDPKESIDLHGFTASFIQYAHARINSILRKAALKSERNDFKEVLLPLEKKIIAQLESLPDIIQSAGQQYNPSLIANYAFALAQLFNSFYAEHSITKAENEEKKSLRVLLASQVKRTLALCMHLLGVDVPERM